MTMGDDDGMQAMLRRAPLLADLPDERLAWVAAHGREVLLGAGERIAAQGDPADGLYIVLDGETEWSKDVGGQQAYVVTLGPGTTFAELILLLDAPYPTSRRAVTPVRLFKLALDDFWTFVSSCPIVLRRILAIAAERSELHASVSQQHAKLIALGTIAAGLAHELNNPAAAISRSAREAHAVFRSLSSRALALAAHAVEDERRPLASIVRVLLADARARAAAASPASLDALERNDREDAVVTWLEAHGLAGGWDSASSLVGAGLDVAWLDDLSATVPAAALGDALAWLEAEIDGDLLMAEIEEGTARISALVQAAKDYSYLDQAPVQEVDPREGLESTLAVRESRVEVVRDYASDVPRIEAHGSELNQVWTNLIANAIDAVADRPAGQGRITVRTARDGAWALVEIGDNGPGIPPEIQEHIFEPFFTTKDVGRGVGRGLDISRRIVVGEHGGDIRVLSVPGETRVQVRLPLGPHAMGDTA